LLDPCRNFDVSVHESIEPAATETDYPAKDLTPDYEAYDENIITFDPDYSDIEVMPETGETFIGAEILLPCGGIMTKGHVTVQKQDADSNLKGTETNIPISDTCEYIVMFDEGDVT
jgi:hypothetical protein